jgi:hypothetical protein
MHDDEEQGQGGVTLQDIIAQRRVRNIRNGVLAAVLLAVLAGAVCWLIDDEPEPPPPPPPPVMPKFMPRPPPPPPLPPPPEPDIMLPPPPPPLPELDESDPFVRESVEELGSASLLVTWLASEDLVRRFVAAVDNIAEGKSPREPLKPLWPTKAFTMRRDDGRELIDLLSWERYDATTDVFVSLDPRKTVDVYHFLQPLFEAAYDDLGYPERTFDETLRDAIDELLRAPVLVGDVEIAPRVISWEYVDPEIESLSAAQKALLRTGPVNAPRIQTQLRAIAAALDIPADSLPKSRVYSTRRKLD